MVVGLILVLAVVIVMTYLVVMKISGGDGGGNLVMVER